MVRSFLKDHNKELEKASKNDLLEFLACLRPKATSRAALATYLRLYRASMIFWKTLKGSNPTLVPAVQKRYLRPYKANIDRDERRCLSIEECSQLIKTRLVSRDQSIMILLAKTGMRRHEITPLDVSDRYGKKRIDSEAYGKANE